MKNYVKILILGFLVPTLFSCTSKKADAPKSTSAATSNTGGCVADTSALGSAKLNLVDPAVLQLAADPQVINVDGATKKVVLRFEDTVDESTSTVKAANRVAFKLCDINGSFCACDEFGHSCTMKDIGQDLTFGPNKIKDHMGLGDFGFVSDIVLPQELIGKDLQLSYAPCGKEIKENPNQADCGEIVKQIGGIKVEGTAGAAVVKAPTANICNDINTMKNPTYRDTEIAIKCLENIQKSSANFLHSAANTYIANTAGSTIPDQAKALRDVAQKLAESDKAELEALFSNPDVFDAYSEQWKESAQATVNPTGEHLALAENPATSGCAGVLNNYAQAKTDAVAVAPVTPDPVVTPDPAVTPDPLAGGPTGGTADPATTPTSTTTSSTSKKAKNADNFAQALALVDAQLTELTEAIRKYNTQEELSQKDLEDIQSGELQNRKIDVEASIANLEELVKKLFDEGKIKETERDANEKKISFKQDQLVKLGGKIDLLAEGPKFRTLEEALKSFNEGDKTTSKTADPTVSKSVADLDREIKTWEAKSNDDLKGKKIEVEKLESKRQNLANRLAEIQTRYPEEQVTDAKEDFDAANKKLDNDNASVPGFKQRIAIIIDRIPYVREAKGKTSKAFDSLSNWWQDSNDEVRAAFVVPFVLVGVVVAAFAIHGLWYTPRKFTQIRATYSSSIGTKLGMQSTEFNKLEHVRKVELVGKDLVAFDKSGKELHRVQNHTLNAEQLKSIEKDLGERATKADKLRTKKINWKSVLSTKGIAVGAAVIGTAVLAAFLLPNVINLTDAPCTAGDVNCFTEKFKQAFNDSYKSLVNSRYNIEVWRARQDLLLATQAAAATATPTPTPAR